MDAPELARSRDDLVLVHACLASRWRGEPNPVDKVPGRIPGALNAPGTSRFPSYRTESSSPTAGPASRPPSRSIALLTDAGALYPGSWSQWETRDLPVERGS